MRRLDIGEHGEVFYKVRADKSVVAYLNYRDYVGRVRRVTVVSKTKKDARLQLYAKVEVALADTGVTPAAALTFGMAADSWLREFADKVARGTRSAASYDTYQCIYDRRIAPVLKDVKVEDLSPSVINNFLKEVWLDSYSSAKTCRTIISNVCGQLVLKGVIPHNYVRDVGRLERGRRRAPRALTQDEMNTWLSILDNSELAIRKDLPDLVRFLLGTGMRVGEALALTWADVDLQSRVVVVESNIVRIKGKGLVREKTKTDSSDRTLQLPRWCAELLRARWTEGRRDRPIFGSSTGTWRDRNNICKDLRTIRSGTAVDWFVTHTARRTVATLLDGAGHSARDIADQLGHARPSMTQDVYMGRKIASTGAADTLDGLVETAERPSGPGLASTP